MEPVLWKGQFVAGEGTNEFGWPIKREADRAKQGVCKFPSCTAALRVHITATVFSRPAPSLCFICSVPGSPAGSRNEGVGHNMLYRAVVASSTEYDLHLPVLVSSQPGVRWRGAAQSSATAGLHELSGGYVDGEFLLTWLSPVQHSTRYVCMHCGEVQTQPFNLTTPEPPSAAGGFRGRDSHPSVLGVPRSRTCVAVPRGVGIGHAARCVLQRGGVRLPQRQIHCGGGPGAELFSFCVLPGAWDGCVCVCDSE